MTFVEAAVAVLEREGRPMHTKDIAEKAVRMGLLSHVGKTPEQTMSARLSAAVAKANHKGPFVRSGRGVFGLSRWEGKPPGPQAAAPAAPVVEKPVVEKKERDIEPVQQNSALETPRKEPVSVETGMDKAPSGKKRKRKKRKTPIAAAEVDSAPPPAAQQTARGDDAVVPSASRTPSQSPPQPPSRTPSQPPVSTQRLSGVEDLMDQVESFLQKTEKPVSAAEMASAMGLTGQGIEMLLEALLSADGLDRESRGQRSRFIKHKSGYRLLEREISQEIISLERQVGDTRERLVQIVERQVLRKLRGLSMSAFARVMITYLHQSGFSSMVPVDLSSPGELHLSVEDRRHRGRFRTAVVLRRDPAEHALSERTVMDLRGAIHHYDAMGGMILTTGKVLDRAIAEGRIANLPPVVLVDGETLARDLVRLGIGVKSRPLSLPSFDEAFFSTLE